MASARSTRDRSGTLRIATALNITQPLNKEAKSPQPPNTSYVVELLPPLPEASKELIPKLKANGKLHSDKDNDVLLRSVAKENSGLFVIDEKYTLLKVNNPYNNEEKHVFEIYTQPNEEEKGGFGYIRHAINVKTGESVVLKFQSNSEDSATECKMLQEDGRLIGEIVVGSKHIIVMDLARGKELNCASNYPLAQQYNICAQAIAETIALHKMGILHRDLKERNFKYDPLTQTVKIFDYGLAQQSDAKEGGTLEVIDSPKGTPDYLAPEISESAGSPVNYNEKTETYALGVMFASMFYMYDPYEHREKTLYDSPDKAPKWAPIKDPKEFNEVRSFLERMLDPDPEKRPPLTEALDFFKKMEARHDNIKARTKNVGTLDIAEYIRADNNQKQAMHAALKKCTEVWLVSSSPETTTPRDIMTAQAALEGEGVTLGSSIIKNNPGGRLSAAELACQIPAVVEPKPSTQFVYNYVHIQQKPITAVEAAQLEQHGIGSLSLVGAQHTNITACFERQQAKDDFKIKSQFMETMMALNRERDQVHQRFTSAGTKQPYSGILSEMKNLIEATKDKLRSAYENHTLTIDQISNLKEEHHKKLTSLDLLFKVEALREETQNEMKIIYDDTFKKLEKGFNDEERRLQLNYRGTDEKVNVRQSNLRDALAEIHKIQFSSPDLRDPFAPIQEMKQKIVELRQRLVNGGHQNTDTVKKLIDKTLLPHCDNMMLAVKKKLDKLETRMKELYAPAPAENKSAAAPAQGSLRRKQF